ncbi:hypothetical protein BC828DRAFT_107053 [Blastocladiella britannica]|nr:hypothetical protein BC828DRAFT_107053 [Blastocladiella britannica]
MATCRQLMENVLRCRRRRSSSDRRRRHGAPPFPQTAAAAVYAGGSESLASGPEEPMPLVQCVVDTGRVAVTVPGGAPEFVVGVMPVDAVLGWVDSMRGDPSIGKHAVVRLVVSLDQRRSEQPVTSAYSSSPEEVVGQQTSMPLEAGGGPGPTKDTTAAADIPGAIESPASSALSADLI